jgi:hypothetical protein
MVLVLVNALFPPVNARKTSSEQFANLSENCFSQLTVGRRREHEIAFDTIVLPTQSSVTTASSGQIGEHGRTFDLAHSLKKQRRSNGAKVDIILLFIS